MGPSLYSGLAGAILFLSAAAGVLGHSDARRAAGEALRSVNLLDPRRERLGGVMGAGSVSWALAWSATLLRDEAFLREAERWAPAPDDERIGADDDPDLAGGSAGAILALLRLHAATGSPTHLDTARRCAEHVVSRQTHTGGWASRRGTCLTGLAHGAAGIAHALFRLHEQVGEERLLTAAVDACGYERTRYVPERGNWQDLRPDVPPGAFMTAWCNGAAGIALARCAWTGVTAEIADDFRRSLQTTLGYTERGVDHLCCGALGRAGILLTCGLRHRDPELVTASRARAGEVMTRAQMTGCYRVAGDPTLDVQHAGFFRGISGIGYQLLRIAVPNELPDVLLLE
jgi:lantibiotic modifying enzyme